MGNINKSNNVAEIILIIYYIKNTPNINKLIIICVWKDKMAVCCTKSLTGPSWYIINVVEISWKSWQLTWRCRDCSQVGCSITHDYLRFLRFAQFAALVKSVYIHIEKYPDTSKDIYISNIYTCVYRHRHEFMYI